MKSTANGFSYVLLDILFRDIHLYVSVLIFKPKYSTVRYIVHQSAFFPFDSKNIGYVFCSS